MNRQFPYFVPAVRRKATAAAVKLAVLGCTLFLCNSVNAFEQRFYGGAAVGLSSLQPDPTSTGYALREDRSSGFELRAGWDFNPRWSFEVYFAELGAAKLEQQQGLSLTPTSGEIDYATLGVSGIAYFYNSLGAEGLIARTGLSLFAGLGLGELSIDSNLPFEQNQSMHVSLTGGAELGWRNGFAARLQISGYDKDAMAVHAGLIYRFGDSGAPHVRQLSELDQPDNTTAVARGGELAEPMQAAAIPLSELDSTEIVRSLPKTGSVEAEIAPDQVSASYSDADADGVLDRVDGCPDSAMGQPVDEIGCAVFEGRLKGLTFEPESADLGSASRTVLDELATQLLLYPDIRLAIMAHTDNSGRAEKNLEISKHRAATVARYLVRRGVSRDRLRAEAYGESNPVASNKSAAGRVFNRRIELRVW